jgi:hypothetical protein
MTARAEMRKRNVARLRELGFRVAPSLPVGRGHARLRAAREIAMRLCALDALFMWVSASEDDAPTNRVRAYADRSNLRAAMTGTERKLFETPRAKARAHVDTIGWRLENMWPLAWVLGFDKEPDVSGAMISTRVIRAMLLRFMPRIDASVDDLLAKVKRRRESEVMTLEDLFYCAHNAARSAQLGEKTVPKGFDPIASGGVIHERRHALTWATSPRVSWAETDLST